MTTRRDSTSGGTFGERLRRLRRDAGLTQVELATQAGLVPQAVANLEQELRQPMWSTVVALCRVLHVSPLAFWPEIRFPFDPVWKEPGPEC